MGPGPTISMASRPTGPSPRFATDQLHVPRHLTNVPSTLALAGTEYPRSAACSPTHPSSQVRGDDRPAIRSHGSVRPDLRHFLDLPDDVPAPARRMAEHLSLIVRAAPRVTLASLGQRAYVRAPAWSTALPGTSGRVAHRRAAIDRVAMHLVRRRGRDQRLGTLTVDLRLAPRSARPNDDVDVVIDAQVAATLRSLMLIAAPANGSCSGHALRHGIILEGNEDDLDELIGYVAAEANHEHDRRRQKRLDAAFDISTTASIDSSTRSQDTPRPDKSVARAPSAAPNNAPNDARRRRTPRSERHGCRVVGNGRRGGRVRWRASP